MFYYVLCFIAAEVTVPYADFFYCPTAVALSYEHDVGGWCYSVCHRENGDLLLGCVDGVWLLRDDDKTLSKGDLACEKVYAVKEHHKSIYILHKTRQKCKVGMCLPSLKQMETLFEFSYGSRYVADMAVSDDYVVAYAPEESDPQLLFYNFITQQTTITQIATSRFPHFLPDGQLLLAGKNELIKYIIEEGQLKTPVWTCKPLPNLNKVCADSNGLIYATTHNGEKSIYIISPQGTALLKLFALSLRHKNDLRIEPVTY